LKIFPKSPIRREIFLNLLEIFLLTYIIFEVKMIDKIRTKIRYIRRSNISFSFHFIDKIAKSIFTLSIAIAIFSTIVLLTVLVISPTISFLILPETQVDLTIFITFKIEFLTRTYPFMIGMSIFYFLAGFFFRMIRIYLLKAYQKGGNIDKILIHTT
jgi:hypothetical protein